MNKEQKEYLKVVCNFLNNTKGCIYLNELKFLLKWLSEGKIDLSLFNNDLSVLQDTLNDYVVVDDDENFIEKIEKFIKNYKEVE